MAAFAMFTTKCSECTCCTAAVHSVILMSLWSGQVPAICSTDPARSAVLCSNTEKPADFSLTFLAAIALMIFLFFYQDVCGYTIPKGHSVCVSPTANQRLREVWGSESLNFKPERYISILYNHHATIIDFNLGVHCICHQLIIRPLPPVCLLWTR